MKILGIETSCDETAASIIEGDKYGLRVLSNVVFSQINIHKEYGGVVPEVAARNHILKIIPVIERALPHPIPPLIRGGRKGEVDAIAVTAGPGLISSLLTGVETAKTLAYSWQKPLVAVNHLAGHIYSAWLTPRSSDNSRSEVGLSPINIPPSSEHVDTLNVPQFPALALIVSGGHTELVLMRAHLQFKIIGQTRDDAAGEAFDKVSKMLNLGYPGGPDVSAQATKIKNLKSQITNHIHFPRPMMHDNNFDFSFSGIKTSVLYKIQKDKNYKKYLPEYCAAFQQAVIDVLIYKTIKAAQKYKVKSVILAGGVAANVELRKQFGASIKKALPKASYHIPALKYTTDNAAMIAAAGYFLAKQKKFTPWQRVRVDCNLKFSATVREIV